LRSFWGQIICWDDFAAPTQGNEIWTCKQNEVADLTSYFSNLDDLTPFCKKGTSKRLH
jgi:hypothetical protein